MGSGLYRLGGVKESFGLDRRLRYDQRMPEPRQTGDLGLVANDKRVIGSIAFDADHLGVIGAADDDDVAVLFGGAGRELLHAGDKRAGRINDLCRFFLNSFCTCGVTPWARMTAVSPRPIWTGSLIAVTPSWASRCISCLLWISGPRLRTVSPAETASSTISTARSTPKQNPYSSASSTCIFIKL